MSLEELLIHDQGISVHRKRINTSLTEIYETFYGENPHFKKTIFTKKDKIYNILYIKFLNPTQNKYKKIWILLF